MQLRLISGLARKLDLKKIGPPSLLWLWAPHCSVTPLIIAIFVYFATNIWPVMRGLFRVWYKNDITDFLHSLLFSLFLTSIICIRYCEHSSRIPSTVLFCFLLLLLRSSNKASDLFLIAVRQRKGKSFCVIYILTTMIWSWYCIGLKIKSK